MSLARAAGPAANFVGRIAGIAVTLLVVRFVGVGPETTPLFLSLALVTFANGLLAPPLELQAIAELGRTSGGSERSILGGAVVLGAAAAVGLAAVLLLLTSFSTLVAHMLPFALPLIFTVPLTSIFAGYLGIGIHKGRWFPSAIASACRTLIAVVILAVLLPRYGLPIVPIALIVGEVARLVLVARIQRADGTIERGATRRYLRRVIVQVPSSVFGAANPTIDRYVVGVMGLGSVAILDLAEKARGFVVLAFTQGLLPPLYRRWAMSADSLTRNRAIIRTSMLTLGGSFAVAVLAVGAIDLAAPFVLGSEAQEYGPTLVVVSAAYLLGLAPYLAGQVLVRLIILEDRVQWLSYTGAAQLALNFALDLTLGPPLGLIGIALASSSVAWLGFGLFVWLALRASRQHSLQYGLGQ